MAERDYDVIVVGAGPAGSCAATVLARAGRSVLLLERGPFAGSKNMYGGVVYPRILDGLHPRWWEEAPIQRWVTRRSTMVLTDTQALTVDFRTEAWGHPPYNGATAFRPDYLAANAPRLELSEPAWLRVGDARLLELPATHSLGMAARAGVGRMAAYVHVYFHDTDLLDERRRRALTTALRLIGRRRRPTPLDALTAEAETDFGRQMQE